MKGLNSAWDATGIRHYESVDLAVAVSIPDGLITPVIRSAHTKGLQDISASMKDLAHRAREGKTAPPRVSRGTFTVSSLGMFGIREFSAIVNPPQAGILGCWRHARGAGMQKCRRLCLKRK